MCAIVPDGMICFFVSYEYLQSIVTAWIDQKIMDQVQRNKLVFVETQDAAETSAALANYRKVCVFLDDYSSF